MTEPNILWYEWTHGGTPSETWVELGYADDTETQARLPLLLRLRIAMKKGREGKSLIPIHEIRVNMLQKKLERAAQSLGCAVPAARRCADVLLLYCYCPDRATADQIAEIAEKARWAIEDSDLDDDPRWDVYRHDLYPTTAQRQTAENENIISLMAERDDDLGSPHRIDHYCTFRDEVSRIGFQEDARKSGFALGEPYFAPDSDLPHGMVVRNLCAIEKKVIDGWTSKLIPVVEKYDGAYHGWDSPMLRKRKTKIL